MEGGSATVALSPIEPRGDFPMPPVAETIADAASPAVSGAPPLILQAEGAALLAAAVVAYGYSGGNWLLVRGAHPGARSLDAVLPRRPPHRRHGL